MSVKVIANYRWDVFWDTANISETKLYILLKLV